LTTGPQEAGGPPGPDDIESLYRRAPCALLVTAPDGTILRANDSFCNWVGRSAESMLGQVRIQDLLTMGSRIFHQTHWAPLLQIQGSVSEVKLELRRHDETSFPAVVNAVRREHAGTVWNEIALFVAEDRHRYEHELVLSRRRAEELLQQEQRTRQALVAAQAELDRQRATAEDRALFAEQMMGIVSHDLRNPLAVIRMTSHILGRSDPTAKQQVALERIINSTNLALRLIKDLLDFTSARLGRGVQLEVEPIDLHALVADCVENLGLAHPRHTIVHEQFGPSTCRASADRIVQAVGNLVSNAAHHGRADCPITVRSSNESGRCRVSVHNNGEPIDPAQMQAIFEPMVRGAHRRPSEGVGLGLFIVREIAHAHGGTVAVESNPAFGTTFTIDLPIVGVPPR
jgi:sigma-B regulation protein RsbU (phosphoserine phosphatase)